MFCSVSRRHVSLVCSMDGTAVTVQQLGRQTVYIVRAGDSSVHMLSDFDNGHTQLAQGDCFYLRQQRNGDLIFKLDILPPLSTSTPHLPVSTRKRQQSPQKRQATKKARLLTDPSSSSNSSVCAYLSHSLTTLTHTLCRLHSAASTCHQLQKCRRLDCACQVSPPDQGSSSCKVSTITAEQVNELIATTVCHHMCVSNVYCGLLGQNCLRLFDWCDDKFETDDTDCRF
jgi:hypothetical protein